MKRGLIQNNEIQKAAENHFRPRDEDILKCDLIVKLQYTHLISKLHAIVSATTYDTNISDIAYS